MNVEQIRCEVTKCECGSAGCSFKHVKLAVFTSDGVGRELRGKDDMYFSSAIRNSLESIEYLFTTAEHDNWVQLLATKLGLYGSVVGTVVHAKREEVWDAPKLETIPVEPSQLSEDPYKHCDELFAKKGMIEFLADTTYFAKALAIYLSRRPDVSGFQNRLLDKVLSNLVESLQAVTELLKSEDVKL